MTLFFWSICAICVAAVAIAGILAKYGPGADTTLLRAALRNLEADVLAAQQSTALVRHNIEELRERLSEQRDGDRARLARCEAQVEANERGRAKLEAQFKDAMVEIKQETTKLSMLAGSFQKKGF